MRKGSGKKQREQCGGQALLWRRRDEGFLFFFFFLALPGLWAEVGQTRLAVFFYSLLTSFECVCLSGLVAGIEKGRGSFLFFSFSFLAPLWGGGGGGKGRGKPVGYRRWGWLHPGGRGKKGSLLFFSSLPYYYQYCYSIGTLSTRKIFSQEKKTRDHNQITSHSA